MQSFISIIRFSKIWDVWYKIPEFIRVTLAGIFFYGWFLSLCSDNKILAVSNTLVLFAIGVSKILFDDKINVTVD